MRLPARPRTGDPRRFGPPWSAALLAGVLAVTSFVTAGSRHTDDAVSATSPDTVEPTPDAVGEEAILVGGAALAGHARRRDRFAGLRVVRHESPARSVVEDQHGGWVATFTDGARTVALAGPERRFDEATAAHGVSSRTWVRVLDEPFGGEIDPAWLAATRTDTSPDVLQVAMEYLPGSPETRDDDGLLVSANAEYGPLQPDGTRPVGADWNDFQQVPAVYGDDLDAPEPEEVGALDCSGYMRMVWGVRHEVPMTWRPDRGASFPRRSFEQAADAPGVVPIPDRGTQVTDLEPLQPGDLVFFDAQDDHDRIDHVGMYLGTDDAGRHRFVSSRRAINGPTMGDHVTPSLLDGDELFARSFVATRRL